VNADSGDDLLEATAERLFADVVTPTVLAACERGKWPGSVWHAVAEAGLHRALVPEEAGGFGVAVADALFLLRVAGRHALPIPLAETMLAGWLLAKAGLPVPEGPLAASVFSAGRASGVAWGRHVDGVAAFAERDGRGFVAFVPKAELSVTPGENIAREPRDVVALNADVAWVQAGVTALQIRAIGAAMRSLQIAGALEAITAMTGQYAQDRVQFGRPIGRFQAVQHNLAVLAGQTAAAVAAGGMAAEAVQDGVRIPAIAAAKARAGEAAGVGAGIAHQIHGAIGFTYEHRLHYLTKRLWAWRDEYGGEAEWQAVLGDHLVAAGPDRLWAALTAV